jgi:hypothetical protein
MALWWEGSHYGIFLVSVVMLIVVLLIVMAPTQQPPLHLKIHLKLSSNLLREVSTLGVLKKGLKTTISSKYLPE